MGGFRVMGLLSLFGGCKAYRPEYCPDSHIIELTEETGLTMSQLEFVGTKVPSEWIPKLKRLTEETGKTQSAIVRDAIAAALGVNVVNPVNPLREELDDLKARVQALEELTQLSMVNQKQETEVNRVKPIAPTSPDAPPNTTPPPIAVTKKAPDAPPIAPKSKTSTPKSKTSTPPIAVVIKPTSSPSKLMRSGELLIALQARGYTRSAASLLRDLNESIAMEAPNEELAPFGVKFDFEAKRSANPRSSNLRWLWIED